MSTFSQSTSKVTLEIKNNQIHIESQGPVVALEFNYNRSIIFTSMLGAGYLVASKNKKLIIVSLLGATIEGEVLRFEGAAHFRNFKAVGGDAKFVKNVKDKYANRN